MPAATSILAAMAGPDQSSVPAGADAIHLHHGWWPPGKIPAPDGCIAHAPGALGRGHALGRLTRGSLRISRKYARHRRPHRHGRPRAGHPPPADATATHPDRRDAAPRRPSQGRCAFREKTPTASNPHHGRPRAGHPLPSSMPPRPIPTAGTQPLAGSRRVVARFAKIRPPPPPSPPWPTPSRPSAPPMPPRPIPTAGTRPRAGSLRVSRKNAHCLRPHHHGRP